MLDYINAGCKVPGKTLVHSPDAYYQLDQMLPTL